MLLFSIQQNYSDGGCHAPKWMKNILKTNHISSFVVEVCYTVSWFYFQMVRWRLQFAVIIVDNNGVKWLYSWHHNQYHRDLHTIETIEKVERKMRERESIINGCLWGFYCVIFGEHYWLISPHWEEHNTRCVNCSVLWQQLRPAVTALTEEI